MRTLHVLPLPTPTLPTISREVWLLLLRVILLLPLPIRRGLLCGGFLVPRNFLLSSLVPTLPRTLPCVPLLLPRILL